MDYILLLKADHTMHDEVSKNKVNVRTQDLPEYNSFILYESNAVWNTHGIF